MPLFCSRICSQPTAKHSRGAEGGDRAERGSAWVVRAWRSTWGCAGQLHFLFLTLAQQHVFGSYSLRTWRVVQSTALFLTLTHLRRGHCGEAYRHGVLLALRIDGHRGALLHLNTGKGKHSAKQPTAQREVAAAAAPR